MNLTRDLTFLVLYVLGFTGILYWRRRQSDPALFFYCGSWTFMMMVTYFIVLEIFYSTFYFLIPLVFFSIFAFSYFTEKRKLLNGVLFNFFLISFGGYLVTLLLETQNIFIGGLFAIIAIPVLLILLFGVYILIVFLFWNGLLVLKRESRSLANLLTLLLAIFLTLYTIFQIFFIQYFPQWFNVLFTAVPLILFYLFVVFYNFITVSFLYQFNRPRYNQNYIIVLGAGLLNGETVSPLLAKRIDKAIAFYWAQSKATLNPPILLMSGGQGSDEKVPEAIAMKQYALAKGIPERYILVEANSKTTLENMRFSKELMDQQTGGPYRAIFTSNNYHIFRAGLYAKQAGLKADGIGAKTAFYYLPNAFLREYIAILVLHKKGHLIVGGLIVLFTVLFAALSIFI
ncbi:YdcF family protein [Enterococcus hirae]|uniref:YdcF family protein n=1 Tax=Enterococcus hirae TaxID=1354 RepID=UPI000B53FB3D|nr:YdcF family protein [Enterococcus hirae]OWW63788.1 membrane protein [Enterococcus hirae 67-03-C5]EMF0048607.1 YdcF family protein [Enterococcus hirae]EMF0153064.1 YdcF family protein [Enterococcus hirae]EMF0176606.1 YdcF family protein [Enterococcus hirae]MBV6972114.1 YdcF family protein [Enterococcus hirae]